MFIRKVVAKVVAILVAMFVLVTSASAEIINAVVTDFCSFNDEMLEVEVVTEDGEIFGYLEPVDTDVQTGDVVVLTLEFNPEEEELEVVDVLRIDHITPLQMVMWLVD